MWCEGMMIQRTAVGDGSRYIHLTIFTVHIVRTTARIIPQPDTNVLDLSRSAVSHLKKTSTTSHMTAIISTMI